MKVPVTIDGVKQVYDLTPVKRNEGIDEGDRFICRRPDTGELVRVRIQKDWAGVWWAVVDDGSVAPYRFSIKELYHTGRVYKINF
jgi:hypothetical protein